MAKSFKPESDKSPWTKEEDQIVISLVKKYSDKSCKKDGPRNWSMIAQYLPGRIGKQCRERYFLIHMCK